MDCQFLNGCPRFSRIACGWLGAGLISLSFAVIGQETALSDKPVVGKNADGYLEVFKVDGEGRLRHRWQRPSDADWGSWSMLGNTFLPGIAVASNREGEMQVFAVEKATQELKHIRQATTNSHEWTSWKSLGRGLRGPVCAGQNGAGLIEVFALDA